MKKIIIAFVLIFVVFGGYTLTTYNRLVSASESADTQWAQVEAQYQRRFDLIPNVVNSVKGAMKQEQAVFGAIADARTRYSGAVNSSDKAQAASEVESAYARLLVVIENYPTLKSSEAVQTLMAQIEGTENRISVERGRYNDSVRSYNLITKRFPGSLLAGMFGYEARAYFQGAAGSDLAPEVNL
jgi:LemA protein